MTSRYGVNIAVRPMTSVTHSTFPSGKEAKPRTVLGLTTFPAGFGASGYRPNILVVLTLLPKGPVPRVARCENAIPRSSAETIAVCRVPRNPRWITDTSGTWPSEVRLWVSPAAKCSMLRNGREGLDVSHVKILPAAWPPAIVLWSADIAIEVIGPDSTAAVHHQQRAAHVSKPYDLPFVPGPIIILRFWL